MTLKARRGLSLTAMLGLTFLLSACHGYYGHHPRYGGPGGYHHGHGYGHGGYGRGGYGRGGYGHGGHGQYGRDDRYRH